MIHWAWLLLAFAVGANVGMVIMAICAVAGGDADERMPIQPDDLNKN